VLLEADADDVAANVLAVFLPPVLPALRLAWPTTEYVPAWDLPFIL
jgi:hypothetical protein